MICNWGYQRLFHTGRSSKYFNDQPLWTPETQISRERRVTACRIAPRKPSNWLKYQAFLIVSLSVLLESPKWSSTIKLSDRFRLWLCLFLHRPSSNCRDFTALSDRTMIRRILQMRRKLNLFASLELGSFRVNIYFYLMLMYEGEKTLLWRRN